MPATRRAGGVRRRQGHRRSRRHRTGLEPYRPNAELVDGCARLRAGGDRAAVCVDAIGEVGGVLPDEASGERWRYGPVPDAVVARAAGFLPAGCNYRAWVTRRPG